MRRWMPAILVLILWPLATTAQVREFGDLEGVQFMYCLNADVCAFSIPDVHPLVGDGIGVVMAGMDAPDPVARCETAERKSKQAQHALSKILRSAEDIALREVRRDRYFRIRAVVEADGHNVADLLIERGLAKPYYNRGAPPSWC